MKLSIMPPNVEQKLREMAASVGGGRWPDWFMDMHNKLGPEEVWRVLFKEAADELEQRSRYAGLLLRRLAGD